MADTYQDHYQVLGVSLCATDQEIKEAFHKLALKCHPDKNPSGGKRFVSIHKAYTILSDPIKRAAFDHSRAKKVFPETNLNLIPRPTRTVWPWHNPQYFNMPTGSPETENGYSKFKVAFFIGGLVVAGYVTYRLVRTCKSVPAPSTNSASRDIGQAVAERIYIIVTPMPLPSYTPTQQLPIPTPQIPTPTPQLPTLPLQVPTPTLQLPTLVSEEASKAVSEPPIMVSLVSAAGAALSAIIQSIYRAWNWIVGVKNSDAASALGTTITSTANSVASASAEGVSKVGKWATDLKASEAASMVGSRLNSSANSLASASVKVGKWASDLKTSETASMVGSRLNSSANSLASASVEVGKSTSSLIFTVVSATIKTVVSIITVIIQALSKILA